MPARPTPRSRRTCSRSRTRPWRRWSPVTSRRSARNSGTSLLQVVFHARIAAERDDGTGYTIDDVADGIVAKLVRRHPHVFGDVTVSGADEVKRNWDEIKREEKRAQAERRGLAGAGQAAPSALDGVPFGQPALALAAQLQRRAARAGVPDELARLDGDPEPGEPAGGRRGHRARAVPAGGQGPRAGPRPRDGAARGRTPLPRSRARLGAFVASRVQIGCFCRFADSSAHSCDVCCL